MITDNDFEQIKKNFSNRCVYCDRRSDRLEKEHFIPRSRGGDDSPGNILVCCPDCNKRKKDKHPQDFLSPKRYEQLRAYLDRKSEAMQFSFFAVRST